MIFEKNKKRDRILLVSIIVTILIICAIIISILIVKKKKNNDYLYLEYEILQPIEELSEVTSTNQFFAVQGCINKFYTYCNMLNLANTTTETEGESQETQTELNKIIYNMLDKEYISYNKITEDNITSKIEPIKDSDVYIDSMYVSEREENIRIYIASISLREKSTNNISKSKMIVKMDYNNKTFSIIPQDYVEVKYSNIKLGDTIDIGTDRIEVNDNNTYIYKNRGGLIYARALFDDFKYRVLYNIDSVYDKLDEEYKKAKFENIEEFKEYIKNKYKNIESLQLSSYSKETEDNHERYIMVDTEEHYFILDATAIMKYTIILDTYTLDLPEFVNKYEYTTEEGKVLLNLNKIMLALNNADYKYVYNKLSDSFKAKNFQTLKKFEDYIKTKLFTFNYFEYKEFGSEDEGYYTCNVEITDASRIDTKEVEKTFIMSLRRWNRF